jgi:hypothetical protein
MGRNMAIFYFILKSPRATVPDRDGVDLADEAAARAHAIGVAHELMRNCELSTRLWRIQVCDDYLQPLFELSFASIDKSISHLSPQLRQAVETVSLKAGFLNDAIWEVRTTIDHVRDTMAKVDQFSRTIGRL